MYMHPFVFYKCDKAAHRYDYPSSVTLGIPCYEILAERGVQELPCKSDRRGNLLAGQGLLRLGQASLTEEGYTLPLQIVHVLLEVPPQVLRGGCADSLTSGCAVGAIPLDDGHHEHDPAENLPKAQKNGVADHRRILMQAFEGEYFKISTQR